MTVWLPAFQYENYFLVSDDGRVFSKRTNKEIKCNLRNGYKGFSTRLNGRNSPSVYIKIHRLVALTFIPNPENKPFVNHLDGVKTNNSKNNLEWSTASENTQHAVDNELITYKNGINHHGSTLSSEDVIYIRNNPEKLSVRQLAKKYNVHHCTIVRCKNKKRYS